MLIFTIIRNVFEKYHLPTLTLSLIFLGLGFLTFVDSVVVKRHEAEQISSYSIGEEISFFPCIVYGKTKDNNMLARDFYGGIVITNHRIENIPTNSFAVIHGTLGGDRDFLVTDIHVESNIVSKIWVSLFALIYIFWKLIRNLKFTTKGIVLLPLERE